MARPAVFCPARPSSFNEQRSPGFVSSTCDGQFYPFLGKINDETAPTEAREAR